ncbi:hypothetical protein V8C44DRAFT_350621 [Trichoderma aethiopicum]
MQLGGHGRRCYGKPKSSTSHMRHMSNGGFGHLRNGRNGKLGSQWCQGQLAAKQTATLAFQRNAWAFSVSARDRATVARVTTLALGRCRGPPQVDRLLGSTQGLGITTLPAISSPTLTPTLIFAPQPGVLGPAVDLKRAYPYMVKRPADRHDLMLLAGNIWQK